MIKMKKGAISEQVNAIIGEMEKHGLNTDISQGEFRNVIGLIGDEGRISLTHLVALPGVKEVMGVETQYTLISREYTAFFNGKGESRIVKVGDVEIGGSQPVIVAEPCAIESKARLFRITGEVKAARAHILTGGIFKPRGSAHSFRGISPGDEKAREVLEWLHDAGQKFGIPVITEVRGEMQAELVAEYVEIC
jgi:3-deoxy-7-phosphoheptulonate synthase